MVGKARDKRVFRRKTALCLVGKVFSLGVRNNKLIIEIDYDKYYTLHDIKSSELYISLEGV